MYIVYAKCGNMKQWRPMGNDGPVINLLYAVCFMNRENAEKDCRELQEANPDYQFEVRERE